MGGMGGVLLVRVVECSSLELAFLGSTFPSVVLCRKPTD